MCEHEHGAHGSLDGKDATGTFNTRRKAAWQPKLNELVVRAMVDLLRDRDNARAAQEFLRQSPRSHAQPAGGTAFYDSRGDALGSAVRS